VSTITYNAAATRMPKVAGRAGNIEDEQYWIDMAADHLQS
jgi:hypothetical protein